MEQALALLVICITIVAFWKNETMLYMVGIVAWLFTAFYLANLTYPPGNPYLPHAATGFALALVLVMTIRAIQIYLPGGTKPYSSEDVQREHRRKILDLTRHKHKDWWDE